MNRPILNHPLFVFAISFVTLWLVSKLGAFWGKKRRGPDEADRQDLGVILAAALSLLGIIIGFSFSMAITRYDLRKTYEEAEANAIGTEYVRAGLLPAADASATRALLMKYLDQRISFYTSLDALHLQQLNDATAQTQTDLWSAVQAPADARPTPVTALVLSGMNDVLNSQGYTQSAWWNRLPIAAWLLMSALGICCNALVGYSARAKGGEAKFLILPLVLSISYLLVADIDSPRGGAIRVLPQNLNSLYQSLHAQPS